MPYLNNKRSFPIIQVIGGALGTGGLIYVLTSGEDDSKDCSFTISAETQPSDCGESTGSASVMVSPNDQYEYLWSTGDTKSKIENISPGLYSVTVSKAGTECNQNLDLIIQDNIKTLSAEIETNSSDCGQDNGSASVINPTNLNYQWSTGTSGTVVEGLQPGSYILSVTEGQTCTNTFDFIIDESPANFDVTSESIMPDCGLQNGSISIFPSPPGNYSYLWSDGSKNKVLSNVPSGEYYVTVTLVGTDCNVEESFVLTDLPLDIQLDFTSTEPHCGLNDGTIQLQVSPEGTYSFNWNNGAETQDISNLTSGSFEVTVTDENGCSDSGMTTLSNKSIIYIDDINTTSGNCIGNGDIILSLSTPGDGPLTLLVSGPSENLEFTVLEGIQHLAELMNIPAGEYTLTIFDTNAGEECSQSIDVNVEDNTPDLKLVDDSYSTEYETSFSENVVVNDEGFNLEISDNFNVIGGTLSIQPNGSFDFVPNLSFSGNASFNYVATDDCGVKDTAFVLIDVGVPNCDFSVTFETLAASCGIQDGSASVTVNEPGNYSYVWSNGDIGSFLGDVGANMYTVTITDNDLGCYLEFQVEVGENQASYISNLNVVEPSCSSAGEISFDVTSSTIGPYVISISYPGGTDIEIIPAGTIFLSDIIPMFPGLYTISVYDLNIGQECTETIIVNLEEGSGISIAVIEIIPPSSPTSFDGVIIFSINEGGVPPFTIWLNGDVWDITSDLEYFIEGISAGEYTIFVTDETGCTSNTLFVTLPYPTILSLEVSTGLVSHSSSNYFDFENPNLSRLIKFGSYQSLHLNLDIKSFNLESQFHIFQTLDGNTYTFGQLVELYQVTSNRNSGSIKFGYQIPIKTNNRTKFTWQINGNYKLKLNKHITSNAFISLNGQNGISGMAVIGISMEMGPIFKIR